MTVTVIDAFADRPFSGNPAAVCVLDEPAPEDWMRDLAAEINLSETAFVTPAAAGTFGLRWLTPTIEVDLCGHATLASAHLLYESGRLAVGDAAQFDTRSGRLTVRRVDEGTYAMDFPATPPAAEPIDEVAAALGADVRWTGRSRFDLFAEVDDEATVRSLDPGIPAVAALGHRGLIATARADEGAAYDVVSRYFAPAFGIDEDPVTGSAHCAIGPYWAKTLGRDEVACFQASRRGGHVAVRVLGDRVELTGQAVTVYHADLTTAASPSHV